ncbi:hypothetical protein Lal_00038039 [Lupinus albus]|nr:hypothetical protein Lal_00038039 [Lupinus albus]
MFSSGSRLSELSLAQARISQCQQVPSRSSEVFTLKRESHSDNSPSLPFLAQARQLSLKRESSSIVQDFTLLGYFEEKLLSAFEPVRTYITMSRDSQRHQATNKPTVYALAVEYRLLYTLIVYYLAPRDLHHDDPIEVDLYLMFTLKENVWIDWPHLLLLNMLGFSTSSDALGYPILISRIIEHALVDYHALDEANNDEAEEDDEEEVEEDPSEYSDSD